MLRDLYPLAFRRYLALPLLGSIQDDFATWLVKSGYTTGTIRSRFKTIDHIDRLLRRSGAKQLSDLTTEMLEHSWASFLRRDGGYGAAAHVRSLKAFLLEKEIIQPSAPVPLSENDRQISEYAKHLVDVRGFSRNTIREHVRTAGLFIDHIEKGRGSRRRIQPSRKDIEKFIRVRGRRLSRMTLQHEIAHVRGFVRFLAATGAR